MTYDTQFKNIMEDLRVNYQQNLIQKVFLYYVSHGFHNKQKDENLFLKGKNEDDDDDLQEEQLKKTEKDEEDNLMLLRKRRKIKTISLFDCKCALVELCHEKFPSSLIHKLLVEKCHWNYHHERVSFEEFLKLHQEIKLIQNENRKFERTMSNPPDEIQELYEQFDIAKKGWIREETFTDILRSHAPNFQREYGKEFFSLMDPNETHRVRVSSHRLHFFAYSILC